MTEELLLQLPGGAQPTEGRKIAIRINNFSCTVTTLQDVTVKKINEVFLCFNDYPGNNAPSKTTLPYRVANFFLFSYISM